MSLSVVTIHLNDLAGLELTLNSLAAIKHCSNVEWIVIDGDSDSQDSSIFAKVRSIADQFVSEPDEGIYDAMNKGTQLASGDYVLFLNAGDELQANFDPGCIDELVNATHPDMIWGQCQECYENGSLVSVKTRSTSWAWYGMPVYHPAIFFRREILGDKPYDTSYRIAADYDLVCRLLVSGTKVVFFNSLVSVFHRGGLSEIQNNETLEEENQVRMKYFRVPKIAGTALKVFKGLNSQLAKVAWLRGIWRKWI